MSLKLTNLFCFTLIVVECFSLYITLLIKKIILNVIYNIFLIAPLITNDTDLCYANPNVKQVRSVTKICHA
jgi:hypothetical protein